MALDLSRLNTAVESIKAKVKALEEQVANPPAPVTDPADQAAVDAIADQLNAG